MIHSGHNGFSEDKPVHGIIRDTEAIPELNKELASLSERLITKGYTILLVNHAVLRLK